MKSRTGDRRLLPQPRLFHEPWRQIAQREQNTGLVIGVGFHIHLLGKGDDSSACRREPFSRGHRFFGSLGGLDRIGNELPADLLERLHPDTSLPFLPRCTLKFRPSPSMLSRALERQVPACKAS